MDEINPTLPREAYGYIPVVFFHKALCLTLQAFKMNMYCDFDVIPHAMHTCRSSATLSANGTEHVIGQSTEYLYIEFQVSITSTNATDSWKQTILE